MPPITFWCTARLATAIPTSIHIWPVSPSHTRHLRQLAECIGQTVARNDAVRVLTVVENERNNLLGQAPVAAAVLIGPEHVVLLANPM